MARWPWNEVHKNPNARRQAWNHLVAARLWTLSMRLCRHGRWDVWDNGVEECVHCGRQEWRP
jgi:hypothetical protein